MKNVIVRKEVWSRYLVTEINEAIEQLEDWIDESQSIVLIENNEDYRENFVDELEHVFEEELMNSVWSLTNKSEEELIEIVEENAHNLYFKLMREVYLESENTVVGIDIVTGDLSTCLSYSSNPSEIEVRTLTASKIEAFIENTNFDFYTKEFSKAEKIEHLIENSNWENEIEEFTTDLIHEIRSYTPTDYRFYFRDTNLGII